MKRFKINIEYMVDKVVYKTNLFETEHFVIVDSEYKISFVEVAKEEINSVQFAELKAKSGWHYGFDTSE